MEREVGGLVTTETVFGRRTKPLVMSSVKFFQCNVVKYESQAKMFLEMLKWSPGGAGVFHCAIVNAGVAERGVLVEDKDVGK